MAYEQMKKYGSAKLSNQEHRLSNVDFLTYSAFSKVLAGTVTYPYQVIRARLQTYDADQTYKNARDVVGLIFKQEGISGFYKGLGPNLLRVVPSSCVTFLVYENARLFLPTITG